MEGQPKNLRKQYFCFNLVASKKKKKSPPPPQEDNMYSNVPVLPDMQNQNGILGIETVFMYNLLGVIRGFDLSG